MTKEEFFKKMAAANKCRDSYDRMLSVLLEADITIKLIERKALGRCYERTTYQVEMPWRLSDLGKETFFWFGLVGGGQSQIAHEVNPEIGDATGRYEYRFIATCDSSD